MNDLQLWHLLGNDNLDVEEVVALLEQLKDLPLSQRFPFFGRLDAALMDGDPRLRRAAIGTLAGASGLPAYRWIVRGLSDDDPSVRLAATEALRESATYAPARWAHALFHHKADVRQATFHGEAVTGCEWFNLFLLSDPTCADTAAESLMPSKIPSLAVSTILELTLEGKLSRPNARRLIAGIGAVDLDDWIGQATNRSEGDVDWILAQAEVGNPIFDESEPTNLLDRIFDLFWDEQAEREVSDGTGWSPLESFFEQLNGGLLEGAVNSPDEVVASCLVTAARRGRWLSRAAEMCTANMMRFLLFAGVPREVRYKSIHGLYKVRDKLDKFDGSYVEAVLKDALFVRPSGSLDLWAIGGTLHFVRTDPISQLVDWFGINRIISSFLEDPKHSASICSVRDNSPQGQQYLIEQINCQRRTQRFFHMALLVYTVPSDVLDFLDKCSADECVRLFDEMVKLGQRPELSLNNNKTRIVGQVLGNKLDSAIDPFLNCWLQLEEPKTCKLGLEILGNVSRVVDGHSLVDSLSRLSDVPLQKLLRAIAWCQGFPYGKEIQIARSLINHKNELIREWATSRYAVPVEAPKSDYELIVSEAVAEVSSAAAAEIVACIDADLANAVVECLRHPHRGLCAALQRRTAPVADLHVCAALIGCHDSAEDVDKQFSRFSSEEREFLSELDVLVVSKWERQDNLTLLGHAWLHRWEPDAFAFGEELLQEAENVVSILRLAGSLTSHVLARQIWLAVRRIIGLWHRRAIAKAQWIMSDGFGRLLVNSLTSRDGDLAAEILIKLFKANIGSDVIDPLRPNVASLLPDLDSETRTILKPWVDSRGLGNVTPKPRPVKTPLTPQLRAEIADCDSIGRLSAWCCDEDPSVVEEAALKLIELGEAGTDALVEILRMPDLPASALTIAGTVSMWPDSRALDDIRHMVNDSATLPELAFQLACELIARGESHWFERAIESVHRSCDYSWFRTSDWQRLLDLGITKCELAARLATASQPHAYDNAVSSLIEIDSPNENELAAARYFLDCGTSRLAELRLKAADWLHSHGDFHAFPLRLETIALDAEHQRHSVVGCVPTDLVCQAVTSVLAAGLRTADEGVLLHLLVEEDVDSLSRNQAYELILTDAQRIETREAAVKRLKTFRQRYGKLRRVAETFAWGMTIGRELTGRLFTVEMIGGNDLGFTRLEQNRIFVSPLPILRREKNGEQIVEALILHELGHHMYHRGEHEQTVWKTAEDERLHSLLNLVSDEHLERNLRARERGFGDRLKRLGAYAFQHAKNDVNVTQLLLGLRSRAFEVLTRSRLRVSRDRNCVTLDNGQVLFEMERSGMSFPRFFRALRMGLGNRHGDPKVDQALALFKGNFRGSSMDELLEISRELRRIFGDEVTLLDCFSQDSILRPGDGDITVEADGATNEELQSEIRRITDPKDKPSGGGSGSGPRMINVIPDESFETISTIVPVAYDRERHAVYASQVMRHALRLRKYFAELGVAMVPERRRLSGKRIDRTRIRDMVLRGDPRMLVARHMEFATDLFMGIIVDCSGSMTYYDNMEQAKRFGVMLAEAAKGMRGIDLRLFGFTDALIYDAGDAGRPAVSSLEAGGGNNDAAALWHAARVALTSQRRAKLLVMISDGLPTECSVSALRALVTRLTNRMKICCAQIAVNPLEEICFPHYVEVNESDVDTSVRRFGEIIARLVRTVIVP